MLRGRADEEIAATSLAMLPHFVFGGTYNSFLNILNPGPSPVNLELSAHDDKGNSIGETVQLQLAPGESRRTAVAEFFRVVQILIYPPPLVSGYIRIREKSGGTFRIAGNIEITGQGPGGPQSLMLTNVSDTSARNWLLPFAASSGEYFTGYAIANPNELLTVQTDVVVEVVDSSGAVRGTTMISLSPRHRVTSLIPAGVPSGYVRITSNLPIHVLGSIGTHDERLLDQLPAIP
jgi:hypothetical protein